MERFRIITLIDITRTNASRSETDATKVGQQANFNSFLQTINLRANIAWTHDPVKKDGSLPHPIDGKAIHWIWEFETERDELFLKDGDQAGLLIEDLSGVPVIAELENSADIDPAVIQTSGRSQNTWVQII